MITTPARTTLDPKMLAVHAARAASEKQAHDVRILEVRDQISITEYFVICSGGTDRQVRAIGDAVEEGLREAGAKPIRREGERENRWLLLDYADVIIHVFTDEDRAYYELERLWSDVPKIPFEETTRVPAGKAAAATPS